MSTGIQNQQNNNLSASEQIPQDVIVSLVLSGDLSRMNDMQKVEYYNSFCKHLKLNPLTQPFQIINMKGKLVMYARKDATDQLRKIYGVSVTNITKEQIGEIYIVTAYVKDRSGREDSEIGAVSLKGLSGETLANALMKASTKAKRRATLSICGLGILDETEVEDAKKAEAEEKKETFVNIDTIDPNDAKEVARLEEMLQAIPHPLVSDDLFGNQSKEEFINDFRQNLMDGTLPINFANNVFNKVLECFQTKQ